MKTENAKTAAPANTPSTFASQTGRAANVFSRKIGNTTFYVSVVFSEKSSERIEDKILRLVASENQEGAILQCN
jgi:hypothetical protein